MIILEGKLRQSADHEYDGKKSRKVWIEHEIARPEGMGDLKIEQFFLPENTVLPASGNSVKISVRPYASGRDVKFQALGVVK